jgi:hypothetical protein
VNQTISGTWWIECKPESISYDQMFNTTLTYGQSTIEFVVSLVVKRVALDFLERVS